MTCSLQMYRARIGTFYPRPIKKSCIMTRAPKSSTSAVPLSKFLLVFYFVLLISKSVQLLTPSDSVKHGSEYTWTGGPTPSLGTNAVFPDQIQDFRFNVWDPGIKTQSRCSIHVFRVEFPDTISTPAASGGHNVEDVQLQDYKLHMDSCVGNPDFKDYFVHIVDSFYN